MLRNLDVIRQRRNPFADQTLAKIGASLVRSINDSLLMLKPECCISVDMLVF